MPAGPRSVRANIMRARHLRQRGRSVGISDGSTGPNTGDVPGPGGDDPSLFPVAGLCSRMLRRGSKTVAALAGLPCKRSRSRSRSC
jgi:hypothetical protein